MKVLMPFIKLFQGTIKNCEKVRLIFCLFLKHSGQEFLAKTPGKINW